MRTKLLDLLVRILIVLGAVLVLSIPASLGVLR